MTSFLNSPGKERLKNNSIPDDAQSLSDQRKRQRIVGVGLLAVENLVDAGLLAGGEKL